LTISDIDAKNISFWTKLGYCGSCVVKVIYLIIVKSKYQKCGFKPIKLALHVPYFLGTLH